MCNSLSTATEGRVVLFEGSGKDLAYKKFPVRKLNAGEVLVKNVYTTLCGSDIHTYCGVRQEATPTVLGHEIVGEIVEIAPGHCGLDLKGQPLHPGNRITWSVFASDPESLNSLAGIPQKGDHLFKYGHAVAAMPEVFHGGLGEYCILKSNTGILKLPQDLPLPIAATLNCSVSTVAGALRLAGNIKGKNVLITGMGHLGITCAAMCKEAGVAWVVAADISDSRLSKAGQFGADVILNLTNEQTSAGFKASLPNGRLDIVFDMSGSPDAIEFGLNSLAVGGVAVWVGAVFNTRNIQVNPEAVIRNLITIRGLHNYNYNDLRYALDFIESNWNRYPFDDVVEKEFSLEETQEAFAYAVEYKPFRVGIRI